VNEAAPQRYDQIVELLIGVQKQLNHYVRALVPNRADAEEVLQETNLFIWRHAEEYELGTNFAAWASKIAYYQVLKCRRQQARSRCFFSDALVEQLALTSARHSEWRSSEGEAFERCFDNLPEHDRELVRLRYEPGATVQSIARKVGRSTAAVYKALGRIRTRLLECMHLSLSARRRT
jgi:RNA polymerase sigma-70 factor (ECF subfamily)